MKTTLSKLILITLVAACPISALADVPDRISYQGIVTDISGNLVGDPTPVTRYVTFRVWNAANGTAEAKLVYSERQELTIFKGEFSALIGAGEPVVGNPLGYDESDRGPDDINVEDVFSDSNRYLGVTVDDGTSAADFEISPRQQFVTTAYAFRAKIADRVADGSIDATAIASASVGEAEIIDLSIATQDLMNSAITTGKIKNGTIVAEDLADGGVTAAKLGSDVGLWSVTGSHVYRGSGRVGIGTDDPDTALQVEANHISGKGQIAIVDTSNPSTSAASRAVITGFGNNIGSASTGRLWYLGSTGQSNNDVRFFNHLDGLLSFGTNNNTFMHLVRDSSSSAYRVGIGTEAPAARLHIDSGNSGADPSPDASLLIDDDEATFIQINSADDTAAGLLFGRGTAPDHGSIRYTSTDNIQFRANGNMTLMTIEGSSGHVGIGTTNPDVPLDVGFGTSLNFQAEKTFNDSGTSTPSPKTDSRAISIQAHAGVKANKYFVNSDARIKDIIGQSDTATDLQTLMKVAITDYRHKDHLSHGKGLTKKVIAQELEQVYPAAVNRSAGIVPDIYKTAPIEDGWVELETDLAIGERVRLIAGPDEVTGEVLEVRDGAFRTAFAPEAREVFVYGRQVNDFRSVDYEAIAMLNVSATQEIKRTSDAAIAALREENASLKALLESQAAQLAELQATSAKQASLLNTIAAQLSARGTEPDAVVSIERAPVEQ